MYGNDWEECIGADLRKEIEANNAKLRAIVAREEADLKHAIEESGDTLTLDEKIKIAPHAVRGGFTCLRM